MEITKDALGRDRKRCPRCDGVARHVTVHPDDAQIPQGLVRAMPALPPVEPGQLRCQVCAKGVVGNVRFHPECGRRRKLDQMRESRGRHWAPRTCRKCGRAMPKKVGRPRKFCEACR
jgi:hypothetical protein